MNILFAFYKWLADATDVLQQHCREHFLIFFSRRFILNENEITISGEHKILTEKCFQEHFNNFFYLLLFQTL